MKKPSKRFLALSLCAVMAIGVTLGAAALFSEPQAESLTVSAGLQHLADDAYVATAAAVGENISFTPEWFDEALQGGEVSAITVTRLPHATEGVLKLGYGEVSLGQVVPRETISFLSFVPAEGVRESSFSFMPATATGACGYTVFCRLSLVDGVNCCPSGTKTVTPVSTHAGLSLCGMLSAADPEGEGIRYEILSYPAGGTLTLDRISGAFSYLPDTDFSGEDQFTWRAQDIHGAFSDPVTVSLTVRELPQGALFSDISDDGVQSAAVLVSGEGLLSGEVMGGKRYFHPEKSLTRAAFVAVLLKAAEIEVPHAEQTGFADDADIPRGMRSAVAYAREKGWLGEEESFRPNDAITRAEAARIAAAVLGLGAPTYSDTVSDFSLIPTDTADALYAIYEGGYLYTMADGSLSPTGTLLRGDAARLFARILDQKK